MSQRWKGGREAAQKRYNEKHKERRKAAARERYRKNPEKRRAQSAEYRRNNPEKVNASNAAWHRRKRLEYREAVVSGYGHACICCGVTETLFLELHHPKGDGKADRLRRGGNTLTLYVWLIKNGFPEGYELLCANCHRAIHQSQDGLCPHKKDQ